MIMMHRKECLVNGLPTELLAHIFHLGTRMVGDPDVPFLKPFPVLASHVCHLWRSVALGSPSLWTNITFSEGLLYEHSQIWIERSKDLPLDIEIDVGRSLGVGQDEVEATALFSHVSTILDIIVPHVTRWRKLRVLVDQYIYMYEVLRRLARCASAPLLEILRLYLIDYDLIRRPTFFVPFRGNTPSLSLVSLVEVHVAWSSSLLRDLVEFEMARHAMDVRPSWVDFSRILRDSPRLACLRLYGSGPAEPVTDWQDEPIELPLLESLSLTNDNPIHVSSLFRLLSMPNLKKLSLRVGRVDDPEFSRQLVRPPRSVLSTLQSLNIAALPSDSSTIDAMYEQLTNLESICLHCKYIQKYFFTALMESLSGAMYCPNLTTIITSGISGPEMRSFVAVRAMARIPVKRIVMREDEALSDEDERWLREHVHAFGRFSDVDDMDTDLEY
jgi:F-box-like